jgi:hypothetical protein
MNGNKKALLMHKKGFLNGAVWTGLEPATSAVTGRHSNQLNYQTVYQNRSAQGSFPFWCCKGRARKRPSTSQRAKKALVLRFGKRCGLFLRLIIFERASWQGLGLPLPPGSGQRKGEWRQVALF